MTFFPFIFLLSCGVMTAYLLCKYIFGQFFVINTKRYTHKNSSYTQKNLVTHNKSTTKSVFVVIFITGNTRMVVFRLSCN